jgi:predicted nucleic acid-binding protein
VILVDTSVWIDHLRRGNARLAAMLDAGQVVSHPFVIGELACGTVRQRPVVLALLGRLPVSTVATHTEALAFIEGRRLMGRGLGYVDVHLLAAAALDDVRLWTVDKRLHAAARALGVSAMAH